MIGEASVGGSLEAAPAELNHFGADAGLHPPLALNPQSDETGVSYPSFGSLRETFGGCRIDGMPISCSDLSERIELGFAEKEYLIRDSGRRGAPPTLRQPGQRASQGATVEWRVVTGEIRSYGMGLFLEEHPYVERDNEAAGIAWGARLLAHPQQIKPQKAVIDPERLKDAVANCAWDQFRVHMNDFSPPPGGITARLPGRGKMLPRRIQGFTSLMR